MSTAKYLQRFINRNPRNLERLRLLRKPDGWDLEKNRPHKNFIYKVEFNTTKNATMASVVHYEDGVILGASTHEKAVRTQLYSTVDISAAYNIGRLLARRCHMAGIKHLSSGISTDELEGSKRRASFLEALVKNGIILGEPDCIPHVHLNDPKLTWEPFSYEHTREDKLDELDLTLEPGKGVC